MGWIFFYLIGLFISLAFGFNLLAKPYEKLNLFLGALNFFSAGLSLGMIILNLVNIGILTPVK